MSIATVEDLVGTLGRNPLLLPAQMEELRCALQPRFSEPRALARELIQRDWLTPFQINQLFQGRGGELALGPYLLLERLGEGGMGQVFKARHRKLNQIVALKVIRKERLTNPDALRRFRREIQAAAQMSHPNVVRAYDADEIDGTHFLAMEYVDGTDLGRLLKKQGPLAVAQACEYIRQAALGLQHAFERGLVHRDIKPSNLLLTTKGEGPSEFGTIKLLDLGLARLEPGPAGPGSSSTLTKEQTVIGTPDYISPEQARDSHAADICSDLYSLGCTFYYILAGQIPFPGETPMEKLLKHWCEQPQPIEQLRPEVVPELAAVIRKLMAKAPKERFQTPAELAAALERVTKGKPAPVLAAAAVAEGREAGPALGAPRARSAAIPEDTLGGSRQALFSDPDVRNGHETVLGAALPPDYATPFEFNMEEIVAPTATAPSLRSQRKGPDWNWVLLNGAGALLLLVLIALFIVLLTR